MRAGRCALAQSAAPSIPIRADPVISPRVDEHRQAALRAGLSYVTDGIAGIRRERAGTGWVFYAPAGARKTDKAERKRIKSLVIPPAWSDVWICPDPDGHIQVTARDA